MQTFLHVFKNSAQTSHLMVTVSSTYDRTRIYLNSDPHFWALRSLPVFSEQFEYKDVCIFQIVSLG